MGGRVLDLGGVPGECTMMGRRPCHSVKIHEVPIRGCATFCVISRDRGIMRVFHVLCGQER